MAVDVGSAVGYLDLDISGFLANLRSAQSEADNTSKNLATKIGKNISGVGSALSSAGSTLTKSVTLPLLGVGAAGLKVASDFDKGMSEVRAISGATGNELTALRDTAIDLGATTAFSAGEVASAMTEMAKAGWGSQQIIDGMSGVLDAAAASGEGLASVSTIIADAITGFGMEAKDSTKIADLLTQAANSGTIGIAELGESFKYIAPVAGAMGLNITDITTALSAMSMAGIKGSQAGTSLRTLLTRMVKPTDAVEAAMTKLGISVTNQDGSMKSLNDIVANLRDSFDGLTESEKAKYAATLAGQEGMAGMLSLLNLTAEEYDAIAKSMEQSNGVAQETASIMQDNLQSKVEQLGGSLESLAIKLSDYVMPYIQQFVEWLTTLIDKFTSLDPETQKTILKFAGIAIAAGPALSVIGKFTSGIGSLVTAFGQAPGAITAFTGSFSSVLSKLGIATTSTASASAGTVTLAGSFKALGAVFSKIAWPIAIITTAISAIVTLWNTNEEFRNNIVAIWDQIKATFDKLCSGIVERLNRLGFDFKSIGEVLLAIWKGFCDLLAPYFEGVFNYISIIFDSFVNIFFGVWDFFHALFTGNWQGCWDAIKVIFISVWNGIKDWFLNILNVILGMFDVVLNWFGTSWSECWNAIKTFFVNIWTSVADFFVNIWTSIKDFFVGLWDGIIASIQLAWNWVVGLFSTVASWFYNNVIAPIAQFFIDLWNNIVSAYHTVIDPWIEIFRRLSVIFHDDVIVPIAQFFTDLWNSIITGLQNAWNWIVNLAITIAAWFSENVIQPLKQFFTDLWNSVATGLQNAWTWITNLASTIATWFNTVVVQPVKNFFVGMWDGFKNGARNAWEGVKSIFSSVATFFGNIFKSAWEKVKAVFSTGGKIFDGIKDGIVKAFKTVVNAIIKGINKVVKVPFKGLNGILDKIQNVSIVGVKPFNWITWRASIPQIPMLAKGAVIPANDPFVAVLGDQKHGTNIEAPLSTIQEAVKLVIDGFAKSIVVNQEKALSMLQRILYVCNTRFDNLVDVLAKILIQCAPLTGKHTVSEWPTAGNGDIFDYYKLAALLADVLKGAPIKPNVNVEMKDGDVYLDKERVGRAVAPVVARVVVQKQ